MEIKHFRVEFSGKGFVNEYPCALNIIAPDIDRAREWGTRQLQAWHLNPKGIRIVATEFMASSEDVEPPKESKEPKKEKKEKTRGDI